MKEVSRILGIPKDTLRYYDRIGLVSPSREHNSYRSYSKEDLIGLMNIQIMKYADFSLEEIKEKFQFHRMQSVDPAYYQEVAEFLDSKKAETRKKIAHLEKVSQLLDVAIESLRDFNHESDQRLAAFVREIYRDLHKKDPGITKEDCDGREN
ncbi:MerR family transcriptional regulator [Paenibacillus thiaminolyticus]|uniref:MerR family transcriptional regulator n=1 Tax=Paenibacillus thiaminolyticus TaxID=49283 RepID=A0AAP9J1V0_PANTH|nr:MerR family transcriptional regulator [Paenibacillus thiaminolyticus]MEC0062713.1 MerR family transcriptional regulator [Paenibacillus thiaminolyticus]MEC0100580.1 MerR family transcriptional regulator [Paenibacillus thiaminolyticus]QDM44375.1 MerR family transcriptional regulator [Paenibacillus thiaminolyticus]